MIGDILKNFQSLNEKINRITFTKSHCVLCLCYQIKMKHIHRARVPGILQTSNFWQWCYVTGILTINRKWKKWKTNLLELTIAAMLLLAKFQSTHWRLPEVLLPLTFFLKWDVRPSSLFIHGIPCMERWLVPDYNICSTARLIVLFFPPQVCHKKHIMSNNNFVCIIVLRASSCIPSHLPFR